MGNSLGCSASGERLLSACGLESNEEERDRVTTCGGEVGQLNTGGGTEIGPLRCWTGGLCLSRSLGDMDVSKFKVPVPYVKQVRDNTPPPACFDARSKWSSFERYGDEERRKA